jgi:hypothetical protein
MVIVMDRARHIDDRLTHRGLFVRPIAQIVVVIGPDHHGDPEDRCGDRRWTPQRSSRSSRRSSWVTTVMVHDHHDDRPPNVTVIAVDHHYDRPDTCLRSADHHEHPS